MGRKKKCMKESKNQNEVLEEQALRTQILEAKKAEEMLKDHERLAMMNSQSLAKQKEIIRDTLLSIGTDCRKNDADPTGNGDQSTIKSSSGRQAARDLSSISGDIHNHAAEDALSTFGTLCMFGELEGVRGMVNDTKQLIKEKQSEPWYCYSESASANQQKMVSLLETRETSMRVSPLLLIVSVGNSTIFRNQGMDHVGTAKFLLECGANPYAQDVLGETVAHYGVGIHATPMTLAVVDMCVQAAESAHLFGKKVELYGLKAQHMNGLQGIVGGHSYEPEESGRRIVYLMDDLREIKVKPCNIRLVENENESGKPKMLLDVQDRTGRVQLHEIVKHDRKDLAEFMLVKHNASIYIEDMDGVSPLKMCTGGNQMTTQNVSKILHNVACKRKCANCRKVLDDPLWCSLCKAVAYCGRECQTAHWKNGHKTECKILISSAKGVKLSKPPTHTNSVSYINNKVYETGSYRNPKGVRVGEKFDVKVQSGIDGMAILVYDETRTCEFQIHHGMPGFEQVITGIKKDKTWFGRKTFMKASFDEAGDCTIYPAFSGVMSNCKW